jgi:flagellar basal-body rod modification protein FlgD
MTISAVDNTATQSANAARTSLTSSFDTFLTLLTAQLQNQDPLSPMDSSQFTEQLVMYSQVEQQIASNERLDALLAQSQSAQVSGALSYLGREATIASSVTALTENDDARWSYALEAPAQSVQLTVYDQAGRAIYTETRGGETGRQDFDWDGSRNGGGRAEPGNYRLQVSALDSSGEAVESVIAVREIITGVDFTGAEPILSTAAGARPFDSVASVRVSAS